MLQAILTTVFLLAYGLLGWRKKIAKNSSAILNEHATPAYVESSNVCLNAFWVSSFYFAVAACVAASIYSNSRLDNVYESLLWRLTVHISITVILCLLPQYQWNHAEPVKKMHFWAIFIFIIMSFYNSLYSSITHDQDGAGPSVYEDACLGLKGTAWAMYLSTQLL